MLSTEHDLSREKEQAERDVEKASAFPGFPRRPFRPLVNLLGLPAPLTAKQLFYVLGPQCIGAAIIDGAANFGIALAGDIGVHVDLRLKRVDPFPFPWPDPSFGVVRLNGPEKPTTRHGKLWRYLHSGRPGLGRGLHFFSGSDVNDIFDFSLKPKEAFTRLFWSVWKGSVLSACLWFIWWPIAIAIIVPIWGESDLRGSWMPEILKLIFGFTLGLVMNPIVACIALGSEDAIRLHLRDEQKALWAEQNTRSTPMTLSERVAPRPSLDIPSRKPSIHRSNSASVVDEPLSIDVKRLRNSLELSRGSAATSPRSSLDLARTRPSLDLPSRPSFDRRSISEHGELGLGDLRPPRPSLERRRTSPGQRSLSLDLAKSRLENALAERQTPASASPRRSRISLDVPEETRL